MLPESHTAIIARNETWRGSSASEGYEAGWAREAVIFVRALKPSIGPTCIVDVEISPDGIHWISEGTSFEMPVDEGGIAVARIKRFGNWLRVRADLVDGAEATVLVTLHLKA
jgi:hypothetical protein